MKIIFLDFDGPIIPLHSHKHLEPGKRERAWPPCVSALNRITDTTGAKLVISSSWRYMGQQNVCTLLTSWGVTGEVAGMTTTKLEKRWTPQDTSWEEVPRGLEIQDWLDKNPCGAFVIFDDDADMAHLEPHLIMTPFEIGITEKDADEAIARLQKPARRKYQRRT